MRRPNIILISIDTLRADHLSCYGYERKTTPNIDRIAEKGIIFKNAYSTAVWTPPAHASMLTGLYPCQHGVTDQNQLDREIPTIATTLHENGYHTVGFVNNSQVGELVGLEKGHEDFYEIWEGFDRNQILKLSIHKMQEIMGYSDSGARRTNHLVYKWIKNTWDNSRPFYLFIHYIDAHNPLKAPHPYLFKFLKRNLRKQIDVEKIWQIADNPLICLSDNLNLNDAEIDALTALYDEEINYLDSKIGELFTWFEANHLLDNTIFILTADHGEHLGEHGLYSHVASLYEPIIHIPMIFYHPFVLGKGVEDNRLVQLVDLMPTVLEAASISKDSNALPGICLISSASYNNKHEFIISEWEGRVPTYLSHRCTMHDHLRIPEFIQEKQTMIRENQFKLVVQADTATSLYNLDMDPSESNNLATVNIDQARILKKRMETYIAKIRRDNSAQSYHVSPKVIENLKALGYI